MASRIFTRSLSTATRSRASSSRTLLAFSGRSPTPRCTAAPFRRWATTSADTSSFPNDPADAEAQKYLEEGTKILEDGDVDSAKVMYLRSVEIKKTAGGLFNLGVTHFHSKDFPEAIEAWKQSIELDPANPDAHTNIASAYIMSPIPQPALALQHLKSAAAISPDDPEIAFNLGAVLEACGFLQEALAEYKKSSAGGVERAAVYVRNVSAKILGQQLKEVEDKDKEKTE